LIPRIIAKYSKCFNIDDCRFRVTEDKISTARVVSWNEFKIMNSFTIETSFFGYVDPEDNTKTIPFSPFELE
jgi:hypothetical protein